jgi:diguanylate cyclase (GGDEF)-like protein
MKITETRPQRPVRALRPAAAGSAGAVSAQPPSVGDVADFLGIPAAELTPAVRQGLQRLMAEVERLRGEVEQRERRIAHLEKLADEDPLAPPILNRRAFVRELSRMMAYSQRYATPAAVVYLDVNGLKGVNDRLGHAAGDAVLAHVARLLIANVRSSDVVGRLGGDEFGVLLAQSDQRVASTKALSLAAIIAATPFDWNGSSLGVTVAVGAYGFEQAAEAADILDAADREMYRQKRGAPD